MIRSHLTCGDIPEECHRTGGDWTLIPLKLDGAMLDACAAYFDDGIGYSGRNISKLQGLSVSIHARKFDFVIYADWNLSPE